MAPWPPPPTKEAPELYPRLFMYQYSSNLPSWVSISDLRGLPSLLSPTPPPPPPSPKELATGSGSHSFDEDDPWTEKKISSNTTYNLVILPAPIGSIPTTDLAKIN